MHHLLTRRSDPIPPNRANLSGWVALSAIAVACAGEESEAADRQPPPLDALSEAASPLDGEAGAPLLDDLEAGVPPDDDGGVGVLDAGALQISGLTVQPNPNSTISCYVSWTTDAPATSEVQFGRGEYEYRITSEELVTEHRVLVIGMYAESEYLIRALSTSDGDTGSVDTTFTTGALPSEVPVAELTVSEPGASQVGWTLTNVQLDGGFAGTGSNQPAVIVMYDEFAVPVWYYINGETADWRGDVSVHMARNGNLVIGPAAGEAPREIDLGGNIVWKGPEQPEGVMSSVGAMSHHGSRLSNGNYVVIRYVRLDASLVDTQLEEYSPNNELVWSFSAAESMVLPPEATSDFCHGNSVTVDLDEDVVYLSCRWLGVVKARRSGEQEVLWHLAGTYNESFPGDMSFDPPESQFSDIHDPEIHDDGTLIVFDNGGLGDGEYHSRVLEYAIDEEEKLATLVWEFPGDSAVDSWYTDEWYTRIWGDADRLENDNVLITAGARGAEERTRIFEVTRDGDVVWELTSAPDRGSYRAERLSPPPLVQRLEK